MKKVSVPKPIARIAVAPYDYEVILFDDVRKHLRYVRALDPERIEIHDIATAGGACSTLHMQNEIVVGVFTGSFKTLVHELSHAAFRILQACNVPAEADNSEAYAYLIAHLYEECRFALNESVRG